MKVFSKDRNMNRWTLACLKHVIRSQQIFEKKKLKRNTLREKHILGYLMGTKNSVHTEHYLGTIDSKGWSPCFFTPWVKSSYCEIGKKSINDLSRNKKLTIIGKEYKFCARIITSKFIKNDTNEYSPYKQTKKTENPAVASNTCNDVWEKRFDIKC